MQIIRWTKGGFGMAAHNYDGDMLTDEIAQVHRSPGFITSNLIGKRDDGTMIKEFEASHGTVSDLWHAHLRGEETSMNPLGLIEALIGAMNHSADLLVQQSNGNEEHIKTGKALLSFTETLRKALHNTFRYGQGTRDMAGPSGLTTEKFIDKVAWRLGRYLAAQSDEVDSQDTVVPARSFRRNCKFPMCHLLMVNSNPPYLFLIDNVDKAALQVLFNEYDVDRDGYITAGELEQMLVKLGVAPMIDPLKRGSASADRQRDSTAAQEQA